VLIIDEAQNLSADVLEQLRLLTNLETSERKLLQIVLIGQPELRTMLARPELEQLAQRVIARYHLDALSEAETAPTSPTGWPWPGTPGRCPSMRRAQAHPPPVARRAAAHQPAGRPRAAGRLARRCPRPRG
jgi:general secretion pathway protein A